LNRETEAANVYDCQQNPEAVFVLPLHADFAVKLKPYQTNAGDGLLGIVEPKPYQIMLVMACLAPAGRHLPVAAVYIPVPAVRLPAAALASSVEHQP